MELGIGIGEEGLKSLRGILHQDALDHCRIRPACRIYAKLDRWGFSPEHPLAGGSKAGLEHNECHSPSPAHALHRLIAAGDGDVDLRGGSERIDESPGNIGTVFIYNENRYCALDTTAAATEDCPEEDGN